MASLDFTSSFIYEEAGFSANYKQGSTDPTDGVLSDDGSNNAFEFGEQLFENGSLIGTFAGTFTVGGSTWIVVETVPSTGPNTGQWKVYTPEGVVDIPPGTINEGDLDRGDYIVPCFVAGTLIQTDVNKRPVEELNPGDLVLTADHGLQPIRWIGSRKLDAIDLALNPKLLPICISQGALGNNVPSRDLFVSPQHRMVISGWQEELLFGDHCFLAAAKHLVNGDTIYKCSITEVKYYHILFDQHEIIVAEDALSESFHPGDYVVDGMAEETRNEIFEIFPDLRNNVGKFGQTSRPTLKRFECMLLQATKSRLH
ncbi:Hint domain-containing protein [Ruegeria sp. HKCCD7221]|uniref:Hint domain-containing protein n=1 Tax=Ruegeria sp. HKCCD7221 TaxID=2683009 RepID=UPI001487F44B|nr:Hint domain-containing protein [Ruegeria sp. HKCCD7221]